MKSVLFQQVFVVFFLEKLFQVHILQFWLTYFLRVVKMLDYPFLTFVYPLHSFFAY